MKQVRDLPGPVVVLAAYVLGSVPFSGILARLLEGIDLRTVGTGTVSGTGLFRVAGLGPKATAEVLGEQRTIPVADGRFADNFPGYGVRLYRIR